MLYCGKDWQPTTIKAVLERLPTSTKPLYVKTDIGEAYLKGKGNKSGDGCLFTEVLCGEIANLLGLPTPDFAVIIITDKDLLTFASGEPLNAGTAFISRRLEGDFTTWAPSFYKRLNNKKDIPKLVIFDTWIKNLDRFPPANLKRNNNNENLLVQKDGAHYRFIIFDHSHCLDEQDVVDTLPEDDWITDKDILGLTKEFDLFLNSNRDMLKKDCEDLGLITRQQIHVIVHSTPSDWGLTTVAKDRWTELLYERAQFLSKNLINLIINQKELDV